MMLTVDGVGEYLVTGKRYLLRPNSLAIVPLSQGHSYYAQPGQEWEFYWAHIRGQNCTRILRYIIENCGYRVLLKENPLPLECMREIVDAQSVGVEFELRTAEAITRLLMHVLAHTNDCASGSGGVKSCSVQLIEYVENNMHQPIRIEEIAKKMYLSSEHLIRTFKKETGQTPYQYIKARRIAKAKELLKYTNVPLKRVANVVGYSSVNAFGAQFRASTGMTPHAYRLSASNK
ncbi:MAG: helix-turn-helix domain-containing protein [Christensenellales bacterium]